MSRADEDFGTGDTFADFHNNEMFPSWIEALKMDANGRDREAEFSRRNQGEISSGPAAEWDFIQILVLFQLRQWRQRNLREWRKVASYSKKLVVKQVR